MRVDQLMEGQEDKIARLHTRTPVRLYLPLNIRDAIRVSESGLGSISKHDTGSGLSHEPGFPVTHTMREAVKQGDVVLQFWDKAERLAVPDQYKTKTRHHFAQQRYPESQKPMVSLFLLNEKFPWAVYHGILDPHQIDLLHLITYDKDGQRIERAGVQDSMTPEEFNVWAINAYYRGQRGERGKGRRFKMMDLFQQTVPQIYD